MFKVKLFFWESENITRSSPRYLNK